MARRTKRKSRTLSRNTSKKSKTRKAPPKSATLYKRGTQKRGATGNWYRVDVRKNGSNYWRKLSKLEAQCKKFLQTKIHINIKEFEKGKFKSRGQAIAVAYSQTYKKYPKCMKVLSKKN